MAAPTGNQFWKLRSKHGRDKLFASPELLWDAACEYFEWAQKNPYKKPEQIKKPILPKPGSRKKPVLMIEVPTMRPFTLKALCLYLGANEEYWRHFRQSAGEDFKPVITRIEDVIYVNKFEGAAVGAFPANFIAAELGIARKIDVNTNQPKKLDYSKLSDKALEEIAGLTDATGPDGGTGGTV